MLTAEQLESQMMAKIEAGQKIEKAEEMTDEYKTTLRNRAISDTLMSSVGVPSMLLGAVGGFGFVAWNTLIELSQPGMTADAVVQTIASSIFYAAFFTVVGAFIAAVPVVLAIFVFGGLLGFASATNLKVFVFGALAMGVPAGLVGAAAWGITGLKYGLGAAFVAAFVIVFAGSADQFQKDVSRR